MKKITLYSMAFTLSMVTSICSADSFSEASEKLCEKIKFCALKSLEQKDLSPQMKQMMAPMMENMCASIQQNYNAALENHKLYEPATRCMESMQGLTCGDLQQADGPITPECEAYQKLVEK